MFGCNTHLLKHIKQAILTWSFRQNIILGCFPVFAAISARDEFIVHVYSLKDCFHSQESVYNNLFISILRSDPILHPPSIYSMKHPLVVAASYLETWFHSFLGWVNV